MRDRIGSKLSRLDGKSNHDDTVHLQHTAQTPSLTYSLLPVAGMIEPTSQQSVVRPQHRRILHAHPNCWP